MTFGRKIFSFGAVILMFGAMAIGVSAQETEKETTKEAKRFEGKRKAGKMKRRGRRSRGARGLVRTLSRLDLSETQKSQVQTLIETNRNSNEGLREELRGLMMKRRDGSITEADKERLQEIRGEFRQSSELLMTSILNVLTEEQKTQLEQMRQQRRERMERRRQLRQERLEQRKTEAPADKDN